MSKYIVDCKCGSWGWASDVPFKNDCPYCRGDTNTENTMTKETCGDCEHDFEWKKDDEFWDEELQMYICSTCVCVRRQSSRIEQLEKKIERLERSIEQNQMDEVVRQEIAEMDNHQSL